MYSDQGPRSNLKWLTVVLTVLCCKMSAVLTASDHALQPDDVGVVKLSHDAGLSQEVPPLFVSIARLQGLDGHADLLLTGQLQTAAAHLSKLTWRKHTHKQVEH